MECNFCLRVPRREYPPVAPASPLCSIPRRVNSAPPLTARLSGDLLLQLHLTQPARQLAAVQRLRLAQQAPAPGLHLGRAGVRHHPAPVLVTRQTEPGQPAGEVVQVGGRAVEG